MTRIYITRINSAGFKKLVKLKQANLNEEWINLEIKSIDDKIIVYLNDKILIKGLEEPDFK